MPRDGLVAQSKGLLDAPKKWSKVALKQLPLVTDRHDEPAYTIILV